MSEPIKPVIPPNETHAERINRSVSRDGAFSKPAAVSNSAPKSTNKGWKPAKGARFRPGSVKPTGRPRVRPIDPRYVKFF